MLVSSEGAAQELLARLTEEGADFGDLAWEFSLDPAARRNRGDLGVAQRRQLPPSLGEPIFASAPGQVVGPLTTERGLQLFRVDEFLPAELDAATAQDIRQRLFDAWLHDEVQRRHFTFPLLDQV
jgi:parvulin-like peptidyl-prolyl isomerase